MSVASSMFSAASKTASQLVKAGSLAVRSGTHLARGVLGRGGSAPTDTAGPASTRDKVIDLTTEAPDPDHMPFPAYDRLSGDSIMRHIRDSDDLPHLREIEAFEQAHKARKGVLQALESRFSELSST